MRFALLYASMGVWLLLSAGCNNKEALGSGCTKDEQCPPGNVCLNRKCEKLCNDDRDCASGRYCDGTICVIGARSGTPQIAGIAGSGSDACVADTGAACVGTHFVVTGSNLGGSEFLLGSAAGSGPQYVLTVPNGGRVQDDLVDLAPNDGSDIVAGDYVLVVSNSAGEDQAGVSLLKGEPGDDADLDGTTIVARINASTATINADRVVGGGGGVMSGTEIVTAINQPGAEGVISSERLPAASGGGGATLYEFIDSVAQTPAGHSGDRMVVRVNASASGIASTTLNTTDADPESAGRILLDLCGDPDGCQISLGTIGYRLAGQAGWRVTAPYVRAPCRFFIEAGAGLDTSDAWTISGSCVQRYVVCNDADSAMPCESGLTIFNAYDSGLFGNDGYTTTGATDTDKDNLFVIQNNACYFAEAPPDTGTGNGTYQNDSSKGFTLFASHPSWGGAYWIGDDYWPTTDPDRACLLIVED